MIPEDFGNKASIADAYVKMGAKPVFTCSYLLEEKPKFGETSDGLSFKCSHLRKT